VASLHITRQQAGMERRYISWIFNVCTSKAEWSDPSSAHDTAGGTAPSTQWIKQWVGTRADLGVREKRYISSQPGIEPHLFASCCDKYLNR